MDNPGWRAARKAAREDEQYWYPQRETTGRFSGVEHAEPLNESFIGGFRPLGAAASRIHPQQHSIDSNSVSPPSSESAVSAAPLSAVERSRIQQSHAPPRMNPHLQVMCGPLLRYDTVNAQGYYRGACLLVTADAGSIYDPHPNLSLEWDPDRPQPVRRMNTNRSRLISLRRIGPKTTELSDGLPSVISGPLGYGTVSDDGYVSSGPRAQKTVVPGQEIWVYHQASTTCTFWRFLFEIPLTETEMSVRYRINQGAELEFWVPGRSQNLRWAAHSCNGFSAGINPDDFRGPGFSSGTDPVWTDLLNKHVERPFHVLVGGGDQIYCDALTREPELQEWVHNKSPASKKAYPMTEVCCRVVHIFYFNHYCVVFRSGAFAQANCSIIDGFGSYPDDLQSSPVFKTIGSRGYFFYLLFQCFVEPSLDGKEHKPYVHTFHSTIIGGDGPWVPYRSHNILTYMGPNVWMLMLDCRAERKKDQVCSTLQYQHVLDGLYRLPASVEHLIVQTGIPIAYPRMNFLETALESKLNPLVALGRAGTLGLSSMVNKFNADAELLDDLNDHWTAKGHKKERNWFIERMQDFAQVRKIRVSFLSGDVHCAAVGVLKTLTKSKEPDVTPALDHRYMLNIVSSAIVNTPPPAGVLSMVSTLADKRHRTMHYANTDETMVPLFERDPNGTGSKSKYIMGRRNWCQVEWNGTTGELEFKIQVEREKGIGETSGYLISAPPPRWRR
ncbi:hypothetical protein BU17DRAFT_45307 [Hysterangium stoloniferum]|nr:hypothetical protein BU17DRAFT_45307 [Hysterangium stoloniferum]